MNIELALLAVMLKKGDFGPLMRDEITKDHFLTDEGKALYNFIRTYRSDSDGAATFPSLKIVRNRFDPAALDLPEPDDSDTVENLSHEVKLGKFRSDLLRFAEMAEKIANSSEDPTLASSNLLAELRKVTELQQRAPHVALSTGFAEVIRDYEHGTILPQGIPWPWPTMNDATKGLHRGEFVVIAGRPKSRKSFTAFRVGVHAMKNHNCRVLIFTPEMPVRQVFLRCIAHLCDLPYREFKDTKLDAEQKARLIAASQLYGKTTEMNDEAYEYHLLSKIPNLGDKYPSLDIVQSTGRDTAWLASQIQIYEPDLVIYDSFYRHRGAGQKRNDTDWKAVSALSREMKDLNMEMNVAGLGTHQMNRGAAKGIGDLTGLALADAIGADADGIWQVITGKQKGEWVSALVALGVREADTAGILIHNKPCHDFSEIAPITNLKVVLDLMKQEDDEDARPDVPRVSGPNESPRHVRMNPNTKGALRRTVGRATQGSDFIRNIEKLENDAVEMRNLEPEVEVPA